MLFRDAPEILAMMVAIHILAVVPMATFRWWLLLRAIGIQVNPKQTFVLTWIGNFFNTTLPGAVTGDVVKGYYVIKAQEEDGRTRAFMTLLIDRFVGLFGLIVMAFFALVFNFELILSQERLHSLAWIIVALFGGTVLFYSIVLFPFKEGRDPFLRLFQHLPASKFSIKVYSAFKSYQHHKTTLFLTLFLSIGLHTLIALIFDFDVHHGNGTQHFFEERADIYFASIHQDPRTSFPGTGFAHERGSGGGAGFTLNVPVPPGMGDEEYLQIFYDQVQPKLEEYKPDFVLVSAGFDAHRDDPLASLNLTERTFRELTRELKQLAEQYAGGRIMSLLEGGYDLNALSSCVQEHLLILHAED